MSQYQHILAALDLDDDGLRVMRRARDLAKGFGARLSCLHVVEYLPVDPAADAMLSTPIDLSHERAKQAEMRLADWCRELGLPDGCARVAVGVVTGEIMRCREELGADLIVVGHRSRRGLMALFSHTDDGVLSRADCDVLAVYLKGASAD